MSYTTLNDAAGKTGNQGYAAGETKVWYMRPEQTRDLMVGHEFCFKKGLLPSRSDIGKTHVLVGTLSATDPEVIFEMMQGEKWSPCGEARGLIKGLGLSHTSMSIGDVLQIGDDFYFTDRDGFILLDA